MSGNYTLSEGCLEMIMSERTVVDPIVQILGRKKMASGSKETRFRLSLSDGKFKVNIGLYTVNLPDHDTPQALEQYSVIKLTQFAPDTAKDRTNGDTRILMVRELQLLVAGNEVNHEIGNPILLSEFGSTTSYSPKLSNPNPFTSAKKLMQLAQSRVTVPIASLNPFHNNWLIVGRVLHKSDIYNWGNAKGAGKVFNVDLVDRSGEIRCTAFNEVVDMFFDRLEVDKVYYISKCVIQPVNPKYCCIKHKFELTLTSESEVMESFGNNDTTPKPKYNFTTIDKVAVMKTGTVVDVIGICKSASELQKFVSKSTNRELKKKDVILTDQSKIGITLTLWGNQAESFSPTNNPVVLVQGGKISDFRGVKYIGLPGESQLKINPCLSESGMLRYWYDLEGNQLEINNISESSGIGRQAAWMTLKEVQALGLFPGILYFRTFATIHCVQTKRVIYKSCPNGDCQKKVEELRKALYRCDKCNRVFPNFKFSLILSMNISDGTSTQWVTVFSSEAEKILEKRAQEIGELMEKHRGSVDKIIKKLEFKQFVFKFKAKVETYKNVPEVKYYALNINPTNHEEHNAH